jgi:hypothetical protein
VEVTRAHYDACKTPGISDSGYHCHRHRTAWSFDPGISDRKYPDRNSEQYDDDLEASNEDDSEINSFFPFTLSYLDLSTLELKNKLDRFPLPLFLRQEYDHISELINESPRSGTVVNLGRVRFWSPCLAGSNQPCRYEGKTAYLSIRD